MNNNDTKKSLKSSVAVLFLCVVLLIGATFAWFTDSVSSGTNVIKAGNLKISATYQNTAENGTTYNIPGFTRNGGNVIFGDTKVDINENNSIISEDLWEPGAVGAKLITVKNDGSLAAKIKLDFTTADSGLQNALWFDFIQVGADNAVTGAFTEREMSTLSTFAKNLELPLMPKGTDGDSVSFIMLYGMKEDAGNEYMNAGFEADVTILATQYTYEEDSFGTDYDANAEYVNHVVSDGTELSNAISEAKENDVIKLGNNISLSSELNLNKAVTLDLGGNIIEVRLKITAPAGTGPVVVKNGTLKSTGTGSAVSVFAGSGYAQEQIFENMTIEAPNVSSNYAFRMYSAAEGSDITIRNCTITSGSGGLTLQASANYTLDKLTVKAGDGVAIYAGSGSGVYTMSDSKLSNNSATKAAIDITGTMGLTNCTVENAAENGKAIKLVKMGVSNTISGDDTVIKGKLDIASNVTLKISGGIFSIQPADKYIADGMQASLQSDGTYKVVSQ